MVSVCMISYNGEKYIKEQLDSILKQLEPNDEIIISDDGSTDSTLSIISAFNDDRIKVVLHRHEYSSFSGIMGICFNVGRNMMNAMANAKGDCIFFADQDDIWLPGRVKRICGILKEYDLVYTDNNIGDENCSVIAESYFNIKRPSNNIIDTIIRTPFLGCCMAFNKRILQKALPFPSEPLMHDIWVGIIGQLYGKVFIDYQPSLIYRRHGDNTSSSGEKSKNPLWFRIYNRVLIIKAIIKKLYSN